MERNMITVETRYEHVNLDENGVAIIAGTKTKVIELVLDMLAYGWSPEELQFQHPYLTLGQIHSALAYYWDHQELLDEEIERRLKAVDQMQAQAAPVPSKRTRFAICARYSSELQNELETRAKWGLTARLRSHCRR
jgi:uncharacterized protein (DUF433 family)